MTELFEDKLDRAESNGLSRKLRLVESAQGRVATIDSREVVLLGSNNYLGLAAHPAVVEAVKECVDRFGFGAGASRLVCGNMEPHAIFEREIAAFLGKPAALLFGSGYAANVGVITTLMGKGDMIFADRLCHASVIDGARYSRAQLKRYSHNNPDSLWRLISKSSCPGKKLIVTEGLFSMDGDIASLAQIARIADKTGALLMVDDAHGIGVFGPGGRGTVHAAGVEQRVDILVVTMGKALGGAGGVVAGSRSLVEGLINFSRPFVYSTAIPPSAAAAGSAALKLVASAEGDRLRETLQSNTRKIIFNLKKVGYNITSEQSQIIPVLIGSSQSVMDLQQRLLDMGVFAPAIRPPTVPAGTDRFRLSVTAAHTDADLEKVIDAFGKVGEM